MEANTFFKKISEQVPSLIVGGILVAISFYFNTSNKDYNQDKSLQVLEQRVETLEKKYDKIADLDKSIGILLERFKMLEAFISRYPSDLEKISNEIKELHKEIKKR